MEESLFLLFCLFFLFYTLIWLLPWIGALLSMKTKFPIFIFIFFLFLLKSFKNQIIIFLYLILKLLKKMRKKLNKFYLPFFLISGQNQYTSTYVLCIFSRPCIEWIFLKLFNVACCFLDCGFNLMVSASRSECGCVWCGGEKEKSHLCIILILELSFPVLSLLTPLWLGSP